MNFQFVIILSVSKLVQAKCMKPGRLGTGLVFCVLSKFIWSRPTVFFSVCNRKRWFCLALYNSYVHVRIAS